MKLLTALYLSIFTLAPSLASAATLCKDPVTGEAGPCPVTGPSATSGLFVLACIGALLAIFVVGGGQLFIGTVAKALNFDFAKLGDLGGKAKELAGDAKKKVTDSDMAKGYTDWKDEKSRELMEKWRKPGTNLGSGIEKPIEDLRQGKGWVNKIPGVKNLLANDYLSLEEKKKDLAGKEGEIKLARTDADKVSLNAAGSKEATGLEAAMQKNKEKARLDKLKNLRAKSAWLPAEADEQAAMLALEEKYDPRAYEKRTEAEKDLLKDKSAADKLDLINKNIDPSFEDNMADVTKEVTAVSARQNIAFQAAKTDDGKKAVNEAAKKEYMDLGYSDADATRMAKDNQVPTELATGKTLLINKANAQKKVRALQDEHKTLETEIGTKQTAVNDAAKLRDKRRKDNRVMGGIATGLDAVGSLSVPYMKKETRIKTAEEMAKPVTDNSSISLRRIFAGIYTNKDTRAAFRDKSIRALFMQEVSRAINANPRSNRGTNLIADNDIKAHAKNIAEASYGRVSQEEVEADLTDLMRNTMFQTADGPKNAEALFESSYVNGLRSDYRDHNWDNLNDRPPRRLDTKYSTEEKMQASNACHAAIVSGDYNANMRIESEMIRYDAIWGLRNMGGDASDIQNKEKMKDYLAAMADAGLLEGKKLGTYLEELTERDEAGNVVGWGTDITKNQLFVTNRRKDSENFKKLYNFELQTVDGTENTPVLQAFAHMDKSEDPEAAVLAEKLQASVVSYATLYSGGRAPDRDARRQDRDKAYWPDEYDESIKNKKGASASATSLAPAASSSSSGSGTAAAAADTDVKHDLTPNALTAAGLEDFTGQLKSVIGGLPAGIQNSIAGGTAAGLEGVVKNLKDMATNLSKGLGIVAATMSKSMEALPGLMGVTMLEALKKGNVQQAANLAALAFSMGQLTDGDPKMGVDLWKDPAGDARFPELVRALASGKNGGLNASTLLDSKEAMARIDTARQEGTPLLSAQAATSLVAGLDPNQDAATNARVVTFLAHGAGSGVTLDGLKADTQAAVALQQVPLGPAFESLATSLIGNNPDYFTSDQAETLVGLANGDDGKLLTIARQLQRVVGRDAARWKKMANVAPPATPGSAPPGSRNTRPPFNQTAWGDIMAKLTPASVLGATPDQLAADLAAAAPPTP